MILLLGGSGYVGNAIARELENRGYEFATISRQVVDYTDRQVLIELLRETRPEFLINAAGYTGKPNVDACETHRADCLLGNAVLPGIIREACEHCSVPWGHVSSGCIYNGEKPDGTGFTETDRPNFCFRTDNCSFYSGTKALGEECLDGAENVYVWRLRIPFNEVDSSRNYLSKLIRYDRLLDARNSISHLGDFASACLDCWEKRIDSGIYNVTNTGAITTRQVVEFLQRHLPIDKRFEFFDSEAEFMQQAAKTPRSNCVLDNQKLRSAGIPMPDVCNAIERSLKKWCWENRPVNQGGMT